MYDDVHVEELHRKWIALKVYFCQIIEYLYPGSGSEIWTQLKRVWLLPWVHGCNCTERTRLRQLACAGVRALQVWLYRCFIIRHTHLLRHFSFIFFLDYRQLARHWLSRPWPSTQPRTGRFNLIPHNQNGYMQLIEQVCAQKERENIITWYYKKLTKAPPFLYSFKKCAGIWSANMLTRWCTRS